MGRSLREATYALGALAIAACAGSGSGASFETPADAGASDGGASSGSGGGGPDGSSADAGADAPATGDAGVDADAPRTPVHVDHACSAGLHAVVDLLDDSVARVHFVSGGVAAMASQLGAEVLLLHVVEVPMGVDASSYQVPEEGTRLLASMQDALQRPGVIRSSAGKTLPPSSTSRRWPMLPIRGS